MRKILIFSVAFIAALVTMPLVFGLITQYRIKAAVAEAKIPEGILLEVKSYDRGYLSSHAVLNVMIVDPKQLQEPTEIPRHVVNFNIESNIQHGPFFNAGTLGYRTGLAHIHAYIKPEDLAMANEALAKSLSSVFAEQEIVSMDATLNLWAALNAQLHSSSANYQAPDGSVTWGGLDGTLYLSGDNNAMKATLDISPMLLQADNKSSLDFSRITIVSNAKRDTDMPWVGEQTLSVPSFYMRSEDGKEIRFSNLIFTATSAIDGALASVNVDAKADNLQFFSQIIDNTQMRMLIDKLDAKSLVDFSSVTQENRSTLTDKEKQALTHALITMLSPGAKFEFHHEINMPEGDARANIMVQFPDLSKENGKEPPETIAQRLIMELNATLTLQTPTEWLENTLYNIALTKLPPNAPSQIDPVTNVKISPQEALRKDIRDQLKSLSQSGVLINDGTHYAFSLNYERGNIVLNGNNLTQEDITKLMKLFSNQ